MPALTSRSVRLLSACAAALALALIAAPAHANDTPFSSRFAQTVRGDISAVGNTLMTCPASAGCTTAQNGTAAGGALNNNSYTMGYVDVDTDATTFDSSSATVSLPAGSTVLWAGLYWAADSGSASRDTVRFKVGAGAYQTVSAAAGDLLTSTSQPSRYRAFRDVTALLPAAGNGTYTVANVQASTGVDRFAGWALLVAYRDDAQAIRRLNVYDGLGTVDAAHTFSTTIAPFHTPATGPVTTKLGLLAFEGDAGLATETATFNGHALTDGLNPANNAMNSTIESGGTRFSAKSPDYVNQLGMDLDAFTGIGALANDQSSAALAFTSTNEYFMPSAFFLVSDEGPATSTGAGPGVGGVAQDGTTLTADPGTWNGTGPLTYTYQWQRCDAAGANCQDIPGATHSTYTPDAADIGGTIRVVVTATNDAGSSTPVTSAATAVTVPSPPANTATPPPVNTTPPGLPAAVTNGQSLSTGVGSWDGTGPFTYTYQWQRCDSSGSHCVDIPGADDATYTPSADDKGHGVRVVVTATNPGGSTSVTSAATAVVAAGAGAAVADLGSVPGSLVAETNCQQLVGGAKYRRVKLGGVGTVRVRAYTSGPALPSSPVRLTTEITGGHARSVRYLLDGRAIGAGRGSRYPGSLTPAQLGKVGAHTLKTTVRGARGKARSVVLKLHTVPCQTLFTAQRWRTTAGAGLRLRVDSRNALTGLSFTVPSALLPRQTATRRAAGFIRLYVAGRTRPVRYNLWLPKRAAKPRLLVAAGKPTVSFARGGLHVSGLPARTAVAEVTLYRVTKLDAATPQRAYTVKAQVAREAAGTEAFSAKPKPPR